MVTSTAFVIRRQVFGLIDFWVTFYNCSIIEVLEHSVNLSTFSASLFKLSAAEMVPIKKCERSSVVCELLKSIVIIIIEKSTKLMTRQNFLLLNGWSITRIFKKQIILDPALASL